MRVDLITPEQTDTVWTCADSEFWMQAVLPAPRIDRRAEDPVPVQIAAWLRECVLAGTWQLKFPMPAEEDLAQLLAAAGGDGSRWGVRKALEILREEGLVKTTPHRASYITEKAQALIDAQARKDSSS